MVDWEAQPVLKLFFKEHESSEWRKALLNEAEREDHCLVVGAVEGIYTCQGKGRLVVEYIELPKAEIVRDKEGYKAYIQRYSNTLQSMSNYDYFYVHESRSTLVRHLTGKGMKLLEETREDFSVYENVPSPHDPAKILQIWRGEETDDDEDCALSRRNAVACAPLVSETPDEGVDRVVKYLSRRWSVIGLGGNGVTYRRRKDTATDVISTGEQVITEPNFKSIIPTLNWSKEKYSLNRDTGLTEPAGFTRPVNMRNDVVEALKLKKFGLEETCDMSQANPEEKINTLHNALNTYKGMLMEQPGVHSIGMQAIRETDPQFIIQHMFHSRTGCDPYSFLYLMVGLSYACKGGSNKLPFAIVLQGEKQSLKTADANIIFCNYRREHAKILSDTQHLTGRNLYTLPQVGQLSLVFFDEAFAHLDEKEQGLMRNLVTERETTERELYKNTKKVKNNFNLMFTIDTMNHGMSSGLGSRRWLVCLGTKMRDTDKWQKYINFYLNYFSNDALQKDPNKSDFSTYSIKERTECPGMMTFYAFFRYMPTTQNLRVPPYSRAQVDFDVQALKDPSKQALFAAIKERQWTDKTDQWSFRKDGMKPWNGKENALEMFFVYEALVSYWNAIVAYDNFKDKYDVEDVLPTLWDEKKSRPLPGLFNDEMVNTMNFTDQYLSDYVAGETELPVTEGFILPHHRERIPSGHDAFERKLGNEDIKTLCSLWSMDIKKRKKLWIFTLKLSQEAQNEYVQIVNRLRGIHHDLMEDQFSVESRVSPGAMLKWKNTLVMADFFGTNTVRVIGQGLREVIGKCIEEINSGQPIDFFVKTRQPIFLVKTRTRRNDLNLERDRVERRMETYIMPRFSAIIGLDSLKGIHASYFYPGMLLAEMNMADLSSGTIQRICNSHFAREAIQALYDLPLRKRNVANAIKKALLSCLQKDWYNDNAGVDVYVDKARHENRTTVWREQWKVYDEGTGRCPLGNLPLNIYFPPKSIHIDTDDMQLSELEISIETYDPVRELEDEEEYAEDDGESDLESFIEEEGDSEGAGPIDVHKELDLLDQLDIQETVRMHKRKLKEISEPESSESDKENTEPAPEPIPKRVRDYLDIEAIHDPLTEPSEGLDFAPLLN